MQLKISKVDPKSEIDGSVSISISAFYGISHAECVQMVSAADLKLTAVL